MNNQVRKDMEIRNHAAASVTECDWGCEGRRKEGREEVALRGALALIRSMNHRCEIFKPERLRDFILHICPRIIHGVGEVAWFYFTHDIPRIIHRVWEVAWFYFTHNIPRIIHRVGEVARFSLRLTTMYICQSRLKHIVPYSLPKLFIYVIRASLARIMGQHPVCSGAITE